MMKPVSAFILAAGLFFSAQQAYSMTTAGPSGTGGDAASATGSVQQSGKLEAIQASAGRLVIGGARYAYNPLTTVVMIDAKRATVSDLRVGETVRFQASSQGAGQPALLTSIGVQRK